MELDNGNMPYYIIKDWINYIAEKCDSVLDYKLSNGQTMYDQLVNIMYPSSHTRWSLYYEMISVLEEDMDTNEFKSFIDNADVDDDAMYGPTADYIYNYCLYVIAVDRALKKLSSTEYKVLPFIILKYSLKDLNSERTCLFQNIILADKQNSNVGLCCRIDTSRFGYGSYPFYPETDAAYLFGDYEWWSHGEIEIKYLQSDTSSHIVSFNKYKVSNIVKAFKDLWNKAEHYDITDLK